MNAHVKVGPSSNIWLQSLRGRAIDLIDPIAADVDFREIADTLSMINRYGGAAVKPVSVALHTLIACDAAPEGFKPYVLLHDAHEARIGDICTPVAQALAAIGGTAVRHAIRSLKDRHDVVIHAAAGLPMPNDIDQMVVGEADLAALMTERRDFLVKSPKPWAVDAEGARPMQRVYRLRAAPDVADELYARFQHYLPALAGAKPSERRA